MQKRSKKYQDSVKMIDKEASYDAKSAIELVDLKCKKEVKSIKTALR